MQKLVISPGTFNTTAKRCRKYFSLRLFLFCILQGRHSANLFGYNFIFDYSGRIGTEIWNYYNCIGKCRNSVFNLFLQTEKTSIICTIPRHLSYLYCICLWRKIILRTRTKSASAKQNQSLVTT